MGCGQSKLNIYPRKSKSKNSKKSGGSGGADGTKGGNGGGDGGGNDPSGTIQDEGGGGSAGTDDISSLRTDGADGETLDGGDDAQNKINKTKQSLPLAGIVGGPLLAHTEVSESQQNFFKMLDEKIDNGPDYDSSSEIELAKENARLNSLLHDWETASASSRSLPSTPKHRAQNQPQQQQAIRTSTLPQSSQPLRSTAVVVSSQQPPQQQLMRTTAMPQPQYSSNYIPQNVIHQNYGVTAPKTTYNPTYQSHSPSHQPHLNAKVVPGMQYQDMANHQQYKPAPVNYVTAVRQYSIVHHQQSSNYMSPVAGSPPTHHKPSYIPQTYTPNNPPSPYKTQIRSSNPVSRNPNQVLIEQRNISEQTYGPRNDSNYIQRNEQPFSQTSIQSLQRSNPISSSAQQQFTNGELMIQQQIHNQQLQYQQTREYQIYKQSREQYLLQQLEQQNAGVPQGKPSRIVPNTNQYANPVVQTAPNAIQYQTSVQIPIGGLQRQSSAPEVSPKLSMYRKQAANRQFSQELT